MKLKTELVTLCLTTTLVGCGVLPGSPSPSSSAERQQAGLAADVKAALIEAAPEHAAAVGVELNDDHVVLDGFVESAAIRERMAKAASSAAQGRQVVNRIQVR